MSRILPQRNSSSWFDSIASLWGASSRKTSAGRSGRIARKSLRFETLENRSLLSATVLPSISGVVFYDAAGSGSLNSSDVRLANVTVNLYQGSGTTNLLTSTQTNSAGVYQFTNLQAGTYTVQQTVASGYVLPNGGATQTVTITSSNLTGTTGATIDAFTTAEEASASYSKGTTGNVQVAAPEAIGGYRGLYMQLTSPYGGMDMNTNTDVPNTLTLSTGPGASGDQRVIWDGAGSNAATLNPLGLNHVDLTSGGTATGFDLTLGSDHDNATAVFKIYTDSGDWSTATVSIPNTGDGTANQQIFLPFSSFISGSGSGANLTNVGAITLDVSGPGAFDGEVGDITTAGPKVFATNFADTAQSDLSIVKSASPSQATAGSTQPLTYTLTVTNNGPSADTGVIVSDPLPSGVTYVSSSATQGSVTYAGGTITANLGNMADDATATVTVTATVNPDTRGTITNTATVTGNEPDPNLSNNTSTVQTPVVAQTDLAVVKSVNVTQAIAGSTTPMTYTMTVTNNGPSNATGVTLSDTLPSGVTYVSSSAAQGSVTFANGVITGSLGNLADGGSDKVTVVVTVNASTTGTISNTATVTGNETDPNLANNTSTVQTPVVAQTDLAVVKSVDTTQAIAGSTTPMTYTMLVTNNGPSNATGVTLSDTLPSGVTYVSSSAAQGSVTFANGVITGSLGNLADGGSDKVTVVVTVNASTTGTISNTATVTGNETDTNLSNNTSTVQTPVVAQADLAIVKTASASTVKPGGTLTYTLTVTNNGPSNDTGVTINDPLPAGVTFSSTVASQGTASVSNGVLTANLGNLATGASATTTVVVTVDAKTTAAFTNTATVSGTATDPNMANNTSSVTTNVDVPIVPQGDPDFDLAITKIGTPEPVAINGKLTYTITVTNLGPGTANDIVMTDPLPTGESWISTTPGQGTASLNGNTVTVNIGTLAPNGSETTTVVVTVNSSGPLTNTASVTGTGVGTGVDSNLANNQASWVTHVTTPVLSKRQFLGR